MSRCKSSSAQRHGQMAMRLPKGGHKIGIGETFGQLDDHPAGPMG